MLFGPNPRALGRSATPLRDRNALIPNQITPISFGHVPKDPARLSLLVLVDAGCPPRLRAISALGTLQDMIYWENQSPNLLYRLLVRMEHPYNVV